MFERLMARAGELADRAAQRRRAALAEALGEDAPDGVRVREEEDGIAISGARLGLRYALEPGLRWILTGRRR
ncbi:MAG TPA: hypothetical protein VF547_02415 [Allosphingosinicella sp.]|jgi:hypothetical protein